MSRLLDTANLLAAILVFTATSLISCDDDNPGAPDAGDVFDLPGPPFSEQVDEYWGEAPDEKTRLEIFDAIWENLADNYACFSVLDLDWNEIKERYRSEVADAKGYGRFYQLLSWMNAELEDGHTVMASSGICSTPLALRPPLFRSEQWQSAIGACVTPLDDGTLLVYRASDDNPAGLEPGDVIIGYNGVPWSKLLSEIDNWKLPLCDTVGSADQVVDWMRLSAVTVNPHLFAQLDFRRHGSSEIESVSTEELVDYGFSLYCTDQMPVQGVDFPWRTKEEAETAGTDASWGILDGTNIGYIYIYSHEFVWRDFPIAIEELAGTDGLIIDQRYNIGGWPSPDAFDLLFDHSVSNLINCAERDPVANDFETLVPADNDWYYIEGDPVNAYEGPVAVLQGPHAASGGDLFPYALGKRANTRRFGRMTNGSFGAIYYFWKPDPLIGDIISTYTGCMILDENLNPMQKWENQPDHEIWLTEDSVANGEDAVVEAALSWLGTQGAL